ncbi:MAG: shikimate kinase [Streptococcaceae bacterium]|nr:shikimate kinase [Streptococcaceae bacterium]
MSIILIGFMGVGKSTVAKKLAEEVNLPVADMDDILTQQLGMIITDFFEMQGEAAFRTLETRLLVELLKTDQIIATGGGVIMNKENQEALQAQSKVIFLDGDFDLIYSRISSGRNAEIRPIVRQKSKESLKELFDYRQKIYQKLADYTLRVSGQYPREIVEEIIKWLEESK